MELVNDIYKSARQGSSSNLKILLSSFKSKAKERSKLIEHKTKDNDQITTPLIIASRNGHIKCVKILLSYDANIEARGTVKIDDQIIEETSALWAAAAKGEMEIVKLLIKKGANVNSRTKTNSTPLRATAYDGRLDIVSYLVEHGADVNVKNNFENTPLMVACYNGHRSVVNYLIEKGAKVDAQDKQGNTVLHYAVERGHLDIVKDLVAKRASQLANNLGLTPLLLASNDCKIEMVEYFIARPDCSKLNEIHSLELLGATIANEPDAYDIDKAYEFMMRGMRKRYKGDKCVIKKDVLPPIQAYQNRSECQTEDELKDIQKDSHAIHMEGLVVRERVLGPKNTELRFPVRYRGAVFADSANFELCIALWKHAMDIGQQNDLAVVDDLKIFGDFFCHMIQRKVFPSFADVFDVLEHAVLEYEKLSQKIQKAEENKSKTLKDDLESVMHRSLYLLTIFEQLNLTESAEKMLHQLLYRYLCMNPRTKQGKTLVHLAVSGATPTDEHYTKDVCTYPCYKTTKLLLQTGAQVNTIDDEGNTPLHTVVMTKPKQGQQETMEKIISSLYDSGVHEDLTNSAGKTALEVSASKELKQFLIVKRRILLKCLAARAIKHYQLQFTGLVPKSMEMFITAH
ncbi:protein fem-1 homolog B-like [Actinia tenebrosa]|uniref:Protein fem-1 homolog B-like n=1 Tax=Actinia tenebrosa TaxID=6105 RepID=A0A6P8IVJ3_ACTTE|nr:protein fem-1 homolog B-like [Actinia tenebrosa]